METQPNPAADLPEPPPSAEDVRLIEALRAGDEAAFVSLIDRYHAAMVRVAMLYVSDQAAAEDVAQEAWLGVLRGLNRFEGRSSLKTWIFTILTNRAKTRAGRESRTIPFSDLAGSDDEPAVPLERFLPSTDPEWPNHWAVDPERWDAIPESRLLSQETRARIQRAIDSLPPNQREVIRLRDVEGWTSSEVCNVLALTETNQRVLLHRARAKVRRALEQYFEEA